VAPVAVFQTLRGDPINEVQTGFSVSSPAPYHASPRDRTVWFPAEKHASNRPGGQSPPVVLFQEGARPTGIQFGLSVLIWPSKPIPAIIVGERGPTPWRHLFL
jgi:hypothetical protein